MCVCVSMWLCVCSMQHMYILLRCMEVVVQCHWLSSYLRDLSPHLTAQFIQPHWQLSPLTASWRQSWNSTASRSSSLKHWDHLSAPELLCRWVQKKRGKREKEKTNLTFFVPSLFFSFFLFPFEVVRHSFKPHCAPTLNARESVMNMYQHSIWQQ